MSQPSTIRVPAGFRLAGVNCGLKRNAEKNDLSLVVADRAATAAGVYTTNRVVASSVVFNRARTPSEAMRAVVANSGNANACTGERGDRDTVEMARLAAEAAGCEPEQVLVMSTGIIGEYLPMEKIAAGVRQAADRLADDEQALESAARGIMTTDTFSKLAGRTVPLGGREVRITGMAKGAGMIGPRMATMLSVLMTDAPLGGRAAQETLQAAVDESFNCISVDGHMSTSDTVLLLASGAAGGEPLAGDDLASFRAALRDVGVELARMIPDDGEGASHLITIDVLGCRSRGDAHAIAKTVAESPLVKTAVAGADPNWGRIVSAVGYAPVEFDPAGLSLRLNGIPLYERGTPVAHDEAAVSASIRGQRETLIELTLSEGSEGVRFWTSDLTVDYVRFNADYHT